MAIPATPRFQGEFVFQPLQKLSAENQPLDVSKLTGAARESYEKFRNEWDANFSVLQYGALDSYEKAQAPKTSLYAAVQLYTLENPDLPKHVQNALKAVSVNMLRMLPVDENDKSLSPRELILWINDKMEAAFTGKLNEQVVSDKPSLNIKAGRAERVARGSIKALTKAKQSKLQERAKQRLARKLERPVPAPAPSPLAIPKDDQNEKISVELVLKQPKFPSEHDDMVMPAFDAPADISSLRLINQSMRAEAIRNRIAPINQDIGVPLYLPGIRSFAGIHAHFDVADMPVIPQPIPEAPRPSPIDSIPMLNLDSPRPPMEQITVKYATDEAAMPTPIIEDQAKVATPKVAVALVPKPASPYPTPTSRTATNSVVLEEIRNLMSSLSNVTMTVAKTPKEVKASHPTVIKPQHKPVVDTIASIAFNQRATVFSATKAAKTKPSEALTIHTKTWFADALKAIWSKQFGEKTIHKLMSLPADKLDSALFLRILFIYWAQKAPSMKNCPEFFADSKGALLAPLRKVHAMMNGLTLPLIGSLLLNETEAEREFNVLRNALNEVITKMSVQLPMNYQLFADLQLKYDEYQTHYLGLKKAHLDRQAEVRAAAERTAAAEPRMIPPELYPGVPHEDLI